MRVPVPWASRVVGRLAMVILIAVFAFATNIAFARASPRLPIASAASRAAPNSLRLTADHARLADRTLVARAKALRMCLRLHPGHCRSARRRVQRAGLRLANLQRRLARLARQGASANASRASSLTQAPQLIVSGQTLSWTRIAAINQYVFVRTVPGQAAAYSVVTGNSVTPPPVPGTTVSYSVRTNVNGSTFATARSIAYPATITTTDTQAAPVLSAAGQTLRWSQVGAVNTYVFVQKVPGRADQYSVVSGTSTTPPVVPGKTVNYSIRTAVDGSAWAPEVSIAFPASAPPSAPSSPAVGAIGGGLSSPFVKGVDVNLQGWGTTATPQIATEMGSLGVNWEREDLKWSNVEPQRGVYDWSGFDQVVAAAQASGITLLPVVGYAPSWTTPDDSAAYARFIAAAVARYGPGTSANLQWWELWNEPYFSYAWSGRTPNAESYGRDVLAAAQAAKAVAPSVKLLAAAEFNDSPQTGGSSPWQTTWVNDMFTAAPTLGSWIDGVAVHPYGDDPALPVAQGGGWKDAAGHWAFGRIDTVRAQFLAHGVNVPFWITEAGWSTWNVSEAAQAQYSSDLVTQVSARPWIRALFPYCLREYNPAPTDDQSQYGLLTFGTWQPKPAFYALQQGFKTLK